MATSENFKFSLKFKIIEKVLLKTSQYTFNCGTYAIVQSLPSKLLMVTHAYRLVEQIFGAKMATFENSQYHI